MRKEKRISEDDHKSYIRNLQNQTIESSTHLGRKLKKKKRITNDECEY